MGMYTLLTTDFHLKPDTSRQVRAVLAFMADDDAHWRPDGSLARYAGGLPDHPLFAASRWPYMLTCASAYFDEPAQSAVRGDHVRTQSNLKNYHSEIEKFLDWVVPHVDLARLPLVAGLPFLGRYRYETWRDSLGVYANPDGWSTAYLDQQWQDCTSANSDWPGLREERVALLADLQTLIDRHNPQFHITGGSPATMDLPTLRLFLGDIRKAAGLSNSEDCE